MPSKECFIIMPITTPKSLIPIYRDDPDHFAHVLEELFIPAVQEAGFRATPPIVKGSDVIHSNIIHAIERADLVLCDLSSLNPNVLFEMGVRTALNKPLCLVKDDLLGDLPFDPGIVQCLEYDSSLASWVIKQEIAKLKQHIAETVDQSAGENPLWKTFGLMQRAQKPPSGKGDAAPILARLLDINLEDISRRLLDLQSSMRRAESSWPDFRSINAAIMPDPLSGGRRDLAREEAFLRAGEELLNTPVNVLRWNLVKQLERAFQQAGLSLGDVKFEGTEIALHVTKMPEVALENELAALARKRGFTLRFQLSEPEKGDEAPPAGV